MGASPRTAAGANHTLFLRSDGTLWASGVNAFGQLGDGSLTSRVSPVRIGADNNWVGVAVGADHTLALKADGSLWAWGRNNSGQLGDGSTVDRKSPVRIGNANDWSAVAAGGASSFALKGDGTLWAWGRNNSGQLGNGNQSDKNAPVPVLNTGASRYTAISAGDGHGLALQADGTLWAWGDNRFGQIGQSPADAAPHSTPAQVGADSDWTAISAGGLHSLALKADGTIWGWGDNTFGQIGQSPADPTPHPVPAQVGTDRDWVALSAGDLHTLAVKRGGTLWAWGDNTAGQLGDGSTTGRSTPLRIAAPADIADIVAVAAGAFHSLALKANGELFAWGDNGSGQMGTGTTVGSFSPLLAGADVISWVGTEPGGEFSVALRSNGTLWTWGDNTGGQLGDDTFLARSTPEMVGTGTNWLAQAAGWSHAVALRADGTLWTWGDNTGGQLGDGTTTNRPAPTPITVTQPASAANDWSAVAAGDFHTLALKADGTLWAWGDNTNGQLGDGTLANRTRPVRIVTNNPGNFDSHWVAIAAGGSHSLALQADGTLWVWGGNGSGQLGDPAFGTGVNAPRQIVDFTPPTPGWNSNWAAIAAGLDHSLALQADGTLWAWGSNFSGQLGNGDPTLPNPPDQPAPVLVPNPGAVPYAAIAAGDSFSVARKADGTLWTWGNNTSGQLGNGASDPDPLNPVPHPTPAREAGNAVDWVAAAGGGSHVVALKAPGTLWTWGKNAGGQLGDGSTIDRNAPAPLVEGRIEVLPATVPFGTVAIGTSPSRTVTIGNAGTAPLNVTALTLGGADGAMFSVSAGTCGAAPFAVPAAGSCTVGVVFSPVLPAGVRSATLLIASSDPISPTETVNLTATAVVPFVVNASVAVDSPAGSGTITPSGAVLVVPGDRPAFSITPAAGYHVADVRVDGASMGAVTALTLPPVTANVTITASFAINTYTVTMNAGANGIIAGAATVNHGATPSYTITPAAGYHIADVTVDGVSAGAVAALTLPAVTAARTIAASFAINNYTITVESGARGTVSPSGSVTVAHGAGQTFAFAPAPGYNVVNVLVDGVSQGSVPSYTFGSVTSDNHAIKVLFIPDGDVNSDGKVDIGDALRTLRIVVGLVAPGETDILHGDAAPLDSGGIPLPDRQLTVGDALMILRKVVGLTAGW